MGSEAPSQECSYLFFSSSLACGLLLFNLEHLITLGRVCSGSCGHLVLFLLETSFLNCFVTRW